MLEFVGLLRHFLQTDLESSNTEELEATNDLFLAVQVFTFLADRLKSLIHFVCREALLAIGKDRILQAFLPIELFAAKTADCIQHCFLHNGNLPFPHRDYFQRIADFPNCETFWKLWKCCHCFSPSKLTVLSILLILVNCNTFQW